MRSWDGITREARPESGLGGVTIGNGSVGGHQLSVASVPSPRVLRWGGVGVDPRDCCSELRRLGGVKERGRRKVLGARGGQASEPWYGVSPCAGDGGGEQLLKVARDGPGWR